MGVLPAAAGGAEGLVGGGVAAALGGEVAAEAEHVRPAAQPAEGLPEAVALGGVEQVRGWGAEGPGVGDEPAGVGVGVGGVVDRVDGDPGRRWPVVSVDLVAYFAR